MYNFDRTMTVHKCVWGM